MSDELNPETKAALEKQPPEKPAPPVTGTFSLVALTVENPSHAGLGQAIWRIAGIPLDDAVAELAARLPRVLRRGLTYTDAIFAQLELVCCDCVSVLLRDSVATEAAPGYLGSLYAQLRRSPEFEHVAVLIGSVPADEAGKDFLRWFLGRADAALPVELRVMRKKARAMQSWAEKIGGTVIVADPLPHPTEDD